MSQETKEKSQEEIKAEKLKEFLQVRDLRDNLLYETTEEELEEILTEILLSGSYTKTFSLYKGVLELTYSTIPEKDRLEVLKLVRQYSKENPEASQALLDAYTSKANIAAQLVRLSIKKNVINLRSVPLPERIEALSEQSEDILRTLSKYLVAFSSITYKAFEAEDVIKNF